MSLLMSTYHRHTRLLSRSGHVHHGTKAPGTCRFRGRLSIVAFLDKPGFVKKQVELAPLKKELLKTNLDPDVPQDVFGAQRVAKAWVFEPADGLRSTGKTSAVVFGHGFSQPVENYESTIQKLCEEGWLVIAPTTGLGDVFGGDKLIEGTKAYDKLPDKLQTAMILDLLRSFQYLRSSPDYNIGEIAWAGHSMGAASAIVAASYCKAEDAQAVAVFAPQVSQMSKTLVNDDIYLSKTPAGVKSCHAFFTNEFALSTPLVLICGDDDKLASEDDANLLFTIAHHARQGKDVILYTIDGGHIGFEDRANVEVHEDVLAPLFWVINFLVYRLELLKFVAGFGDPSLQKESAQRLLVDHLKPILNHQPNYLTPGKALRVRSSPDKGLLEEVVGMLRSDEEIAKDFSPLNTGLLAAYSALHATSLTMAAGLLSQSLTSGGSLNEDLGLLCVTGMAAALTFENALLAGGRLLENNKPLLKELSKFRFLAHSGVPLLLLTGMDIADRAGVKWVDSPISQGLIGLAVLTAAAVSTVRNTYLLQISDKWEAGVLRFTYSSPELVRILPALTTCALLSVLGVQASLYQPELWPFAAGPILCTVLSAIPSKVAPQFLTGNAGEVLLIGGLVIAEATLQAMGM